jgi:cation-transporting P-type ATPase E
VQPRTAATLAALILSLCVLVLLAVPLTWRRIVLVGAVLAGFALLFPVPVVRRFYALQLPHSGLATMLIIAALGAAALAAFWVLSRRRGRGPPPVVRP